jgi:23S rRNA pseudouridine2605 synthase
MVDHAPDPNLADASGQAADAASAQDGGAHDHGERVAKALARAGIASRREVERLIAAGRVSLNGAVLTTPAVKVAPGDLLKVDGKPVGAAEATRVWRYHKPVGLVTTHSDPKGRPTVFGHLPPGLPRVISVGRLDLNSEGLLLLTNDGALARALELPATGVVRRYRARARGRTTQAELDTLKDGLTVDGVHYGPIDARLDKAREKSDGPANLWITLTLTEGKNREVRKVLEALGLTVNRLIRLTYGPFQLGTLASGAVEEVGPRVIREQLAGYIEAANLPQGTQVQAAPARRAPAAPKPQYKPGWARPKKPAHPPRAKAKPSAGKPSGAKPRAKPALETAEARAHVPRQDRRGGRRATLKTRSREET